MARRMRVGRRGQPVGTAVLGRYAPSRIRRLPPSILLPVGHLIKRADLDFARPWHGIGTTLHPCDRFVHVLHFPEPESGDQLAGLGERTVVNRTVGAVKCDTLALRD